VSENAEADPDPERHDSGSPERLTFMQRRALKRLRRMARRGTGEPLEPDDWKALWGLEHTYGARTVKRFLRSLPGSPRCGMCGAPFEGAGRMVTRPLGYRPSRKNPHICATCVELSPPGGTTTKTGILFADLRDFTSASEGADPEEVSRTLRRFYGCAEDILFPEAVIDKLIGDEVMALYICWPGSDVTLESTPGLMLDHARGLLEAVGYGDPGGPFVEVGIGLDFGDAFVGNIGDRAVYDFTAIGDVVNTAARLQGEAAGGEIVISERVAAGLDEPAGEPVELNLKGKSAPEQCYRVPFEASSRPA
jgi:adenylate cyclase